MFRKVIFVLMMCVFQLGLSLLMYPIWNGLIVDRQAGQVAELFLNEVDAINVVLPHDTTHLGITTGEDYCTLVTCTPFGVNTHRLLVRGTRIPYEEAEQITAEITVEEAAGSTWEEKYVNGILTGFTIVCLIAILGGVIWFSRRR